MEVSSKVQSLFSYGFNAELSISSQTQKNSSVSISPLNDHLSPLPAELSANLSHQEDLLNFSVGFRKSATEIQDYFRRFDSKEIDEEMTEYRDNIGRRDLNSIILKKMFNLESPAKQQKIHSMLREIDKTEEFMEILFGRKNKQNTADNEYSSFNLKLELFLEGFSVTNRERTQASSSLFVRVEEQTEVTIVSNEADPLVFDLKGDGIQTTGIKNGALFDMTGNGKLERTSFVTDDDFLLALDHNKNGSIDSIKELFGDANGFADGIAELSSYDTNKDGMINEQDEVWSELVLFNYTHGIVPISQAGISEISLDRRDVNGISNMGDRYSGEISFFLENGTERTARDYYFRHEKS